MSSNVHDARRSADQDRPLRSGTLLPPRDLAIAWLLIVVIAALAWVITTAQARHMGIEPGTMGMALPVFLVLWLVMMAAMMLPSVAPVAITWAKGIARHATGRARAVRMGEFIGGYLLAWTAFGVAAYGALALTGHLADDHPTAGKWIGATAFALAGLYQLGPLKNLCLRHCRSPISQLMRYASFRPQVRDLRVGLHHGTYCVGCCAALMVVLVPLGVMNIAAMAGLAVVIFLEKLWRHGWLLSEVVGVAFLVLAVLAPFHSWLLPGLQPDTSGMTSM
ncbi:MAG: DUF2182 domain-containing protein [Catenulispora sp.]|nr:DUF2182 domain-containing protein [Catenulispora sp.]NUR60270.1 DUF2182 domain-containing protein [Catenulispora sp.]